LKFDKFVIDNFGFDKFGFDKKGLQGPKRRQTKSIWIVEQRIVEHLNVPPHKTILNPAFHKTLHFRFILLAYFSNSTCFFFSINPKVQKCNISALYGVIFPGKESSAGFSNYRLWESAGFIFAYILQTQVKTNFKKQIKHLCKMEM
jgi:hypothetical protein